LTEEQLLRRLRQYETLLKSYGAKIEELEKVDSNSTESGKSSIAPNGLSKLGNSISSHELNQSLEIRNSGSPVQ
jgi:hypothetical protein